MVQRKLLQKNLLKKQQRKNSFIKDIKMKNPHVQGAAAGDFFYHSLFNLFFQLYLAQSVQIVRVCYLLLLYMNLPDETILEKIFIQYK